MSDLGEIFARDPLELTKPEASEDFTRLIARYREARQQFKLGDKTAGKTAKVTKGAEPLPELDL